MVAPALPKPSERQHGADQYSHVEAEAEQAVLAEHLEVDAVSVEGPAEAWAEIDRPDRLGRERPEPGASEWVVDRDVPSGLEGLKPAHRGPVACLGRLLLDEGFEPNPEPLRGQGCGDDPNHQHGGGETQSPRRAPDED